MKVKARMTEEKVSHALVTSTCTGWPRLQPPQYVETKLQLRAGGLVQRGGRGRAVWGPGAGRWAGMGWRHGVPNEIAFQVCRIQPLLPPSLHPSLTPKM